MTRSSELSPAGMVARAFAESSDEQPRVGEDSGRLALLVGGVVQSVAVDSVKDAEGYWWAMLPDVRPRRALLLGLGGGTVAQLLFQRFGNVPMTGVEFDEQVLELARSTFLADVPIDCHLGDAHEFIATTDQRFDYVCVDLFRGEAIDRSISGRPFLRQLARIVPSGGVVCFNLFRDKRTETTLNRIGRVLRIVRQDVRGKNMVVHTRVT